MSWSLEGRWTAVLGALTLAVCGWALWPAVVPGARAPEVTRVAVPEVRAQAVAPEYPATGSVQPLISGRVNLNSASLEQLEALPGVGPAMAARLVAGRPYRSLADLDAVRGVGEATLARLSPLVSF
ncbi:ComEA family DNA-binding protein [Deinococcus maricopensis]|uniref:Helix-hairpin-helix motif protein n=1 Tax=Deinococcus maricopensis (strain DSM 21211 / LMG 22137 / NRRL B-23946 / LB-34) TaxID=709986 RepID=E8U5T5_DEIML|nr:helix-hairpin-helix domain-containing protein [Deinococcus maricopensis]ADV66424.1 helix-hairpin-helix motif protein [Deinococcus maricopensis DSM 21211]